MLKLVENTYKLIYFFFFTLYLMVYYNVHMCIGVIKVFFCAIKLLRPTYQHTHIFLFYVSFTLQNINLEIIITHARK